MLKIVLLVAVFQATFQMNAGGDNEQHGVPTGSNSFTVKFECLDPEEGLDSEEYVFVGTPQEMSTLAQGWLQCNLDDSEANTAVDYLYRMFAGKDSQYIP
jgi:hypothetical protein